MSQQIQIYQDASGATTIAVQFENDTVWLTQAQLVELFHSSKANISEHIKHIYESGELEQTSTVRKIRTVRLEGKREVNRMLMHYNLDLILSVGYRVNSKSGIEFRRWVTSKLKELLVQGYVINEQRLAQKEQEVKILKSGIQIMARALSVEATADGMEWLNSYAIGLGLLDDYDHESLDKKGKTLEVKAYPKLEEYQQLVEVMRADFDSDVFGKEKDENFQSSVAQIEKGVGDEDFYPSLEEKAAMLLYLITKNHSFVDGNKRIAAACFLLFLKRNNLLFNASGGLLISNEALASLTLYVAASKPEEMETVKRLIISVLNRNQIL